MKHLLHLNEIDAARVLFGLFIGIEGLESSLQDLGNLLNFTFENELESLFAQLSL